MKTELVLTQGCVADNFTVNGRSVAELSHGELLALTHEVVAHATDKAALQWILQQIVIGMGLWEDLGRCEQCGDSVEKYTLNFKN